MAGTAGSGVFLVDSKFSSGNLYFYEKTVGRTTTGDIFKIGTTSVTVGNTSQDVDFQFYTSSSKSFVIDAGSGTATFTAISPTLAGTSKLNIGTSGTPLSFTAGTPTFTLYTTNASTSGSTSAEPFLVSNTQTGAGGVGGRARFYMTTNVALGGWSNALKAAVTYGASGRTTGLGSVFCSELTLSAGTTSGTYTCLEGEIVLGAGASTGTTTSFMYFNVSGAAATTFDSNGVLFELGTGFTSGSGKFWYDNTANAADEFIKVKTESGIRYLALSDDQSWA